MPTFTAGELVYKITGDSSGFRAELVGAEKQVKSSGKNMDKGFSKIKAGLLAIGAAAAFAFGKFVKEAIGAASDAEEVAGKFGIVFKEVGEDANKFAKNLADNYLLSRTEAKKLLSDTGDILSGFGFTGAAALDLSNKVQVLAADLASFSNVEGGVTFASEALTKALLGETEQAKSLGIAIRQDTEEFRSAVKARIKATGETLNQAKAQVIYAEALKQSGNAIGDISRTSNSYANQQRRLSANLKNTTEEFGKGLIPALKLYQKDLIKATEGEEGLGKKFGEFIGKALIGLKLLGLQQQKFFEEISRSFEESTLQAVKNIKDIAAIVAPQLTFFDKIEKGLQRNIKIRSNQIKFFEDGIKDARKAYDDIGKAEPKLTNEVIKNTEKRTVAISKEEKKRLEKLKNEAEKFTQTINQLGETEAQAVERTQKERLATTKNFLKQGIIEEDQAAELRKKINADAAKKINEINRKQWETTVSQVVFGTSTIAGFIGQTAELYRMATDNRLSQIENEKIKEEERINTEYEANVAATEAAILTESEKNAALKALDEQRERDLDSLENRISKKQRKVKREAAEDQKNLSIAQTAFQIPEAAFAAFKSAQVLPFPASAIVGATLAAAAVTFGALKIKQISEQPLPALAEGGLALGPSIIGEAGRELAVPLDSDRGQSAIRELATGIQKTNGMSKIDLRVYLNGGEVLYKEIETAIKNGQIIIEASAIA